jgi:hypothetical protein
MYLPLSYWDVLASSPLVKSSQGGMKVTYKNVGRWMSNSLFVNLVKSGWIGSRLKRTDKLTGLIKQLIENNRSVVLASSSEMAPKF